MAGPFDDLIPANNRPQAPQGVMIPQSPMQQLQQQATGVQMQRTQQEMDTQPLQNANTRTNIQQGQQSIASQQQQMRLGNANAASGLYKDFTADKIVAAYREVAPRIAAAESARHDGPGDTTVVYGWAKAMDPTGSVREGDTQMAQSASGPMQKAQFLISQYHLDKGGTLPPEVRNGLIEEMRTQGKKLHEGYQGVYSNYVNLAKQNGIDPSIFGADPANTYAKEEAAHIRAMGGVPKINGVPIDPQAPQGPSEGVFGNAPQPHEVPHAKDFHDQLYSAMASGQVKSPKDIQAWQQQFNARNNTNFQVNLSSKQTYLAIKAAREGKPFGVEDIADPRVAKRVEEMKKQGTGGSNAFGVGAADGVTLGAADEINAFGRAIGGSLNGEGAFGDLYGMNVDANRQFMQELQGQHPGFYTGGQFVGGMATPIGMGASAPLDLAKAGATAGGIYGFNSADGGLGDRALGGVTGAAAGGVTGAAVPQFFRSMGEAASPIASRLAVGGDALARQKQIEAAHAADALGIDMPHFVAGGPTAHMLGAFMDRSQVAAPTMQRATNKMLDQSELARNGIASGVGNVLAPEVMGDTAIAGAKSARQSMKKGYRDLYGKAEELSGDTRVPLPTAEANVRAQLAELGDTPGGVNPKIMGTLQDIGQNLQGEWTPAGIRRMRTQIRDRFVESGMDQGDSSRRAQMIVDAAEQDMVNGLRASGKADAAAAWQQASQARAAYQQKVDSVFNPILGARREKTGAEVASALKARVKSNPGQVREFINSLPDDQANDVRASIIGQMGSPPNGRQDAEGAAFSLNDFLTHWNDLKGVREHIFDPQTVGALNKLAKVAERAKETGRVSNTSHTGSISIGLMTAGPAAYAPIELMHGNPGAAAGAVLTSIALGLAQHGGAKLLASPNFARRLAQTPLNPSSAAKYWSSKQVMGNLLRSEPMLAGEIQAFQRAINDNLVSRAAASPGADEEQNNQRRY